MSVWEKLFLRKESSAEEKHSIGGSASEKNSAEFDLTLEGDEYANEQGETLRINQIHDGKIQVILNVKGAIPGVNLFDNKEAFDAFLRERKFQKKKEGSTSPRPELTTPAATTGEKSSKKSSEWEAVETRWKTGNWARPLKSQQPEYLPDKPTYSLEADGQYHREKEKIYENSRGERLLVHGYQESGGENTIAYTEENPEQVRATLSVKRKPQENFSTLLATKKMKKVDVLKARNPEFYAFYEDQMAKLQEAFGREYGAAGEVLDAWDAELEARSKIVGDTSEKERIGNLLQKRNLIQVKLNNLGKEWESLDDRFVDDGMQRLEILAKVRSLLAEIPDEMWKKEDVEKMKNEYLEALSEDYGAGEPDNEKLRAEYVRVTLEEREKELEEKILNIRRKVDLIDEGKLPRPDNLDGVLDAVDRINKLLAAPREKTTLRMLRNILDKLVVLEQSLVFESYPEDKEEETGARKKRTKKTKFREEKEVEERPKSKKQNASLRQTIRSQGGEESGLASEPQVIEKQPEDPELKNLWVDAQAVAGEKSERIAKIDDALVREAEEAKVQSLVEAARLVYESQKLSGEKKKKELDEIMGKLRADVVLDQPRPSQGRQKRGKETKNGKEEDRRNGVKKSEKLSSKNPAQKPAGRKGREPHNREPRREEERPGRSYEELNKDLFAETIASCGDIVKGGLTMLQEYLEEQKKTQSGLTLKDILERAGKEANRDGVEMFVERLVPALRELLPPQWSASEKRFFARKFAFGKIRAALKRT